MAFFGKNFARAGACEATAVKGNKKAMLKASL